MQEDFARRASAKMHSTGSNRNSDGRMVIVRIKPGFRSEWIDSVLALDALPPMEIPRVQCFRLRTSWATYYNRRQELRERDLPLYKGLTIYRICVCEVILIERLMQSGRLRSL
jgi:hypothetical protein